MSILTLFTVIAASRPVNKNVDIGAVIRAEPCTDWLSQAFVNYWRTIRLVVTISSPRGKIGSHCSVS